jgi:ABC-type multidrug transport system fused ATPase/permease subunit
LNELAAAFLRPFGLQIALALVLVLIQSLCLLPLPALQGWIIDRLQSATSSGADQWTLYWQISEVCVISIACLLARMALNWLSGSIMNRVSLEFVRQLTDSLHRKLHRLQRSFFDRQNTGDLMARLTNDVGTLLIFLSSSSLQLVADLVLAVGVVVGLLFINWPLALISFLALPLFVWNQRRFANSLWHFSRSVQEMTAGLYTTLSERVSAIRTIRALGTPRLELAAFDRQLDEHFEFSRRTLRAASLQSVAASLISGLSTAALVVLGAILIQKGTISAGQLIAFVAYLGLFYQPLVRLTQFCVGTTATLAAVERITDLLAEPEPLVARRRLFKSQVRGDLRLQNVFFRYQPSGPLVLDGIDLTIEPGLTVGLCGASASGKSTLLNLLPRLYDLPPNHGRILLDGRDIRDIHPVDLRRNVMLVPQHARLFEGTVRYNLTYAAPGADNRLLWRALEAVDLAELITALPQGLEAVIGEHGANLSGGQRQRLALARGLIARPAVLLLDDSTSALDARTESYVLNQICNFTPNQTRIIVSHNIHALHNVNRTIVLEQGRTLSQGMSVQSSGPV